VKKQNNLKLFSTLIFLSCLIFYSCTASTTTTPSDISFEEIKGRVNENAKKLVSLDADGEISIDSPELSNTGTITVSINKPDSVYTKLEGPFGIDVADLLITRNNFIYYKPMDNRVIRGPSTEHYLSIILKIKITFDDLVNAFSGKFTFSNNNEEDKNVSVFMEDGNYLIVIKSETEVKKYWVDPENFYVTKLATYDKDENLKILILYEKFFESDGIYFPQKITINRPKEKQNIWLTYYSQKFNKNRLSYKLKIPKSAKQINWNGN
jgi:outer membrane lipoprotein-sorting protein